MLTDETKFAKETAKTLTDLSKRVRKMESQMRGLRSVVKLAEVEITDASTSYIEFNDIPSEDYSSLLMIMSARSTNALTYYDECQLMINSAIIIPPSVSWFANIQHASSVIYYENTADIYAWFGWIPARTSPTGVFGGYSLRFYNPGSANPKSVTWSGGFLGRILAGDNYIVNGHACFTAETNPIDTIYFYTAYGYLEVGSKFVLYGEP